MASSSSRFLTLTDRLYRWLARGGGHVNPFVREEEVSNLVVAATGLPLAGTVIRHTSLSFLNRKNLTRVQKKLWLLGGGYEASLQVATWAFRVIDRRWKTRFSVYGWGYYFGNYRPAIWLPARMYAWVADLATAPESCKVTACYDWDFWFSPTVVLIAAAGICLRLTKAKCHFFFFKFETARRFSSPSTISRSLLANHTRLLPSVVRWGTPASESTMRGRVPSSTRRASPT